MKFDYAVQRFLALGAILTIGACATVDDSTDLSATDPYEGFNRKIHDTNLVLDRNLLRPVAKGYDLITPALVKHLLGNGFSHLDLPADFANYLIQGDIDSALETLGRFTINTVLGAGGLLDPATEFGLPKEDTDFGITLGRHGVDEGTYWIVPLFGPTTSRDAVGSLVDIALSPTTYLGVVAPGVSPELGIARITVETVHERDQYGDLIDDVLYDSPDSYVTLRSVYLQRRRSLVAGDEGAADTLPDIFDNN